MTALTQVIGVTRDILDQMMPMHVLVDRTGEVLHSGPTFRKVIAASGLEGRRLCDLLELRRPAHDTVTELLAAGSTGKVKFRLRDATRTQLIGFGFALPGGVQVLINLSFGISIIDAVARYRLAGSDFAPTELTLELLYLVEANAAAMAESRDLNQRLQGRVTQAVAEAKTDTLTGLPNRRALDQAMARLIEGRMPFTLAHLDLDYFKKVNDTYGHAAGDRVLETVAQVLIEETRRDDTVARVGGDEFVLLFCGLTDRKRLAAIAGRIIRRLETPIPFEEQSCRISASIGLSISTQYGFPDADRMLADADAALYRSKRLGRARFSFHRDDAPDDKVSA